MARVVQELISKFYLILVNLTVNSHVWLMTTRLNSMGLHSVQILYPDAGSSCMVALSIACAHLAILLEK